MAGRKSRRGGGRAGIPNVTARLAASGSGPMAGWWSANMDGVPVGDLGSHVGNATTATQLGTKAIWGYWDQDGASVVTVAGEGLPAAPWGGTNCIKWFKPYGSDQYYQKLTKRFTSASWPAGGYVNGSQTAGSSQSPADVSARYIMWRYFKTTDIKLDPAHCWLIICTFKEEYRDGTGWHQEGTGWKVIFDNYGQAGDALVGQMTSKVRFPLATYADRWVKWEYRLYQGANDDTGHGGRIELWADGALIDVGYEGDVVQDTVRNSSGHVGSAAFAPLVDTLNWCYPIGQYTSNQTTNGTPDYINTECTSYVGLSYILPLSTLSGATPLATETWTGSNGAAWPAQWTTLANGGTIDIQGNQGRMATPAGAIPGPSALLSGMTAVADSDTTVSMIGPASGGLFGYLSARADTFLANSEVPFNGYQLVLHVNGFAWIQKVVAGAATGLVTHLAIGWPGPGVVCKMRLQVQGSTINGKVWDGAGAEPSTWTFTATDTSLTSGKIGLSSLGGVNAAVWDDLTVTAP